MQKPEKFASYQGIFADSPAKAERRKAKEGYKKETQLSLLSLVEEETSRKVLPDYATWKPSEDPMMSIEQYENQRPEQYVWAKEINSVNRQGISTYTFTPPKSGKTTAIGIAALRQQKDETMAHVYSSPYYDNTMNSDLDKMKAHGAKVFKFNTNGAIADCVDYIVEQRLKGKHVVHFQDECDYGAGTESNWDKFCGILDSKFEEAGLPKPLSDSKYTINYISATPMELEQSQHVELYKKVDMKMSPFYFDAEKAVDRNLVEPPCCVCDNNGDLTDEFVKDWLEPFANQDELLGMMVRVTKKAGNDFLFKKMQANEKAIQYLKQQCGFDVIFLSFENSKTWDWEEFNKTLRKHTIVFVNQIAKRAANIHFQEKMYGFIMDVSRTTSLATYIQMLRIFGYETELGSFRMRIGANISVFDYLIEKKNGDENALHNWAIKNPDSDISTRTKTKVSVQEIGILRWADSFEEVPQHVKGFEPNGEGATTKHVLSKNNSRSFAKELNEEKVTERNLPVFVDGPSKAFPEDYNTLIQNHPHIIGKYAWIEPVNKTKEVAKITNINSSFDKDRS